MDDMDFAGFWIRAAAYIIDTVLGVIVMLALVFIAGDLQSMTDPEATTAFRLSDLLGLIIGIVYFAGFESSAYQATPGKMALGLIVTDLDGRRISAMILLIGFIMVAFTDRKQGLHDYIASTLVVRGKPGHVGYDRSVFE
jgi:uncharacterized RDD family membrane protein YckC